jgi:hypothetical protein
MLAPSIDMNPSLDRLSVIRCNSDVQVGVWCLLDGAMIRTVLGFGAMNWTHSPEFRGQIIISVS